MSDSSELAEALIFDIEHDNEEINDTQASTIAIASVTLAINELRKAINDIGKAADATAGFTADIAAALVASNPYDGEEDYTFEDEVQVLPDSFTRMFGTTFPSLKVA